MTTTTPPANSKEVQSEQLETVEQFLRRYPILTAHLVCHFLSYFSPPAAARAILDHIKGRTNACEWYRHMASNGQNLKEINREAIAQALRHRHTHKGYMAHYQIAKTLVHRHPDHQETTPLMAW